MVLSSILYQTVNNDGEGLVILSEQSCKGFIAVMNGIRLKCLVSNFTEEYRIGKLMSGVVCCRPKVYDATGNAPLGRLICSNLEGCIDFGYRLLILKCKDVADVVRKWPNSGAAMQSRTQKIASLMSFKSSNAHRGCNLEWLARSVGTKDLEWYNMTQEMLPV